ncbi:MAG: hypothetical protein ABI574_13140 [Burkholderiales bacterium]
MPRHYSYRVDHDLGFAPHVWRNVATVCGCKVTTIERWADVGSWVVGTGGNGTGQPNKLIYAMKVTGTPTYEQFKTNHPANAAYLSPAPIPSKARVLVSRGEFYYFGVHALSLPSDLTNIVHPVQGCKRLTEQDIERLTRFLAKLKRGKHGRPNNAQEQPTCEATSEAPQETPPK